MNKFLFIFLRFSTLPWIFRFFIQKKKVTILLFHKPSVDSFNKSLNYLKRKYNIISLESFVRNLKENLKEELPNNSLIITFDDGHITNYDLLPIIKKHEVPLTIFVCAGIINSNKHFWFKQNLKGISNTYLKTISNEERLAILKTHNFHQLTEYPNAQALQKWQVMEMIPYVNFQSHSMFHPILPKCKHEESQYEIFESKIKLESDFQIKIDTISYPNGDYSDREIELAQKAGYKCGITVEFGYNTLKTDPYRLKRISVNDTNDLNELVVKSSGVWAFIKTLNGYRSKFGYTKETEI
jgi:peptidoglycan/xylan/chitin deacetylase (PgdA/CDA1 family)